MPERTFRVALYVVVDDTIDDPDNEDKVVERAKAQALFDHVRDPDNVDIEEVL